MLVFVYGTLKRGYGNNRLLSESTFIEEAVVRGFKAYNSGFPVSCHSENDRLKGEVWDIGDTDKDATAKRTLRNLDSLEGEGTMYIRKSIPTESGLTVDMYVGGPHFWDFDRMQECPTDDDGIYYWQRN